MNTEHRLSLTDGEHTFVSPGAPGTSQQLLVVCAEYPSAGTLSLAYRLAGSLDWVPVERGSNMDLSAGPAALEFYAAALEYRATISGVVGGSGLSVWLSQLEERGFPPGAFEGLRALTTQPYTEANVKNGLQFYFRAAWHLGEVIPTTETRKVWVKVGVKPLIVKLREFLFVAEEIRLELFASPTGVTGGEDIDIHNYNRVNPVATSLLGVKKNVVTVSDGTPFDRNDPEYFFGASSAPQRAQSSIPQGRERIIPPNTEFIVAITNTGSGNARAQYLLDWYEGEPDLPIP